MDEVLEQVLLGAPNVAVALLALYWMSKRLDRAFDLMEKLIEKRYTQSDITAARLETPPAALQP